MDDMTNASVTNMSGQPEVESPPNAAADYAPPSLTSLGGFAATTLGQGDTYSDDGTQMF